MTQKMSDRACMAILMVCVICGPGMLCPSLHADTYDDAERSAKDLMYYYEDYRKLDLDLTMKLVLAISEADESERKDISERASRDAKDRINAEFSKVEKRRDEALRLLDDVLSKQAFREKFGDAQRLKREVNEKFDQISKMRTNIDPVNAYLQNAGLEMERSRHGGCDAYEFETGRGKLDCARTSGCFLIEFKPDNSRAISKGKDQILAHRKGLLENADRRNDLNKINGDFAKCQDFRLTIEAYRFSPEIKDDGSVRVSSASWSTYTVNP